jgi:pyruvate carboxylase
MKMETTIQAPFSGIVKEITVQPGEPIAPGDLLIELEALGHIATAEEDSHKLVKN